MKLSHPLVMTGILVAIGGGLYAAISNMRTMETVDYDRYPDSGGEESRALSALKEDLQLLKAQVGNLRSEIATVDRHGDFVRLRDEISVLKKQTKDVSSDDATIEYGHAYNPVNSHESTKFMPANEHDMEAIAQEQEYQDLERLQHLETSFQAESIDSNWSYATTDTIVGAFQNENISKSGLRGAECRSTLCRIQVNHPDPEAANEFELWFPMMMAEVLPQLTIHQEHHVDGRVTSTLYLAREGYSFVASQ
jgi:hypothetical protein